MQSGVVATFGTFDMNCFNDNEMINIFHNKKVLHIKLIHGYSFLIQ